jgi:hypothetical protein
VDSTTETLRIATAAVDENAGKLANATKLAAAAETAELKAEWAAEIDKLEKQKANATSTINAATKAKDEAVAAKTAADAALAAARTADQEAAKAAKEARTALNNTPEMLTEDVMATYAYSESTWTRTCTATVKVTAKPTWKAKTDRNGTFTSTRTTTDVAFTGLEKAGVATDPKAYPKDDKALVAEADVEVTAGVVAHVGNLVADYYHRRIEGAVGMVGDKPDETTSILLSTYAGAPAWLGDEGEKWLGEHVKARYELEDLTLLVEGREKKAPVEEAPATEDAPEGDAPAPEGDAPAPEGDAPAPEGDAPAKEEAPAEGG